MTKESLIAGPELTVVMAFAGMAFGALYFAALKRSVLLFPGGGGWIGPAALTLGRIGAAAVLLFMAARLGAAPLLAAFAGFLTARALALRGRKRSG